MLLWKIVVPLALTASSPSAAALAPPPLEQVEASLSPGRQTSPQDDLEALRIALEQPGEGARAEREAAIDALLLHKEPQAHRILAQSLRDGDDPDGRGRFLLDNLARRLVLVHDPVFGDVKVRSALLDAHVDAWVSLFVEGEAGLGAKSTPAIRNLALSCVRALTYRERLTQLERVARAQDPLRARAALSLAGGSRDLGLGGWIADHLASPELVGAAREALAALTFAEEPFADKVAFEDWQILHRNETYVQLAEDAARTANASILRVRAEAEATLIAQTARLVTAMARAEAPDWKAIGQETLRGVPPGSTVACLRALRDTLAERAITAKLGGIVTDRLEFARNLRELLARREERPDDYALVLETMAYLAVKDDTTQRAAVEERLVAGLGREDAQIRRAALRGLRRFPSMENRRAVLGAIDAAIVTADAATIAEAFGCLSSTAWTAPDPGSADRTLWIEAFGRVLAMPSLDPALAERAMQVTVLRDGAGNLVDDMFGVLIEIADDGGRDAAVRRAVLQRLPAFARDEERADRYVALVMRTLGDPDASVRRLAATRLAQLPEVSQKKLEQWTADTVRVGGQRLAVETDELVLRELGARLVAAAEQPAQAPAVLAAFAAAAKAVASDPQAPAAEARRKALADHLKLVGSVRARKTAEWVIAAKALLELRARDALRSVLERQEASKLPIEPRDPAVIDAMQLVVSAALLEESRAPWSDRSLEAEDLRRAFEALDRLEVAVADPRQLELRVAVLRDLARPAEVIAAVKRGLGAAGLPGETRSNLLVAGINAALQTNKLGDADQMLVQLEELGTANGHALDLWVLLARARFIAGDAKTAAAIYSRVLDRTPVDAPSWRERYLSSIDARLIAGGDDGKPALLAELRTRADQFDATRAPPPPPELVERFRKLLKSCGG